jgi:hypothetical protein
MSLTAQQLVDVRRYMGYSVSGAAGVTQYRQVVASNVAPVLVLLEFRLTNLSPEEETVVVTTYLGNLATLETDIVGSADNLDTDQAAVWTHNKRERQEREALFDSWCRRLCTFLGFAPGPTLGNSGMQLVRG